MIALILTAGLSDVSPDQIDRKHELEKRRQASTASLSRFSTSSGSTRSNTPAPSDSSTGLDTIVDIPTFIVGLLVKPVLL